MATKTWKIEKDLCRCCHAEGAFDNLAEPRIFLEKEEVYSDMLRECLDIDIPPVPGELCSITYTICNACIIRLRDACNFKKQVQDCEQRFMTLYYKNAIQGLKPETKVKEELEVEGPASDTEADIIVLKKEDEDDDDDNFLGGGDDDAMSDDDLPIKPAKQSVSTMKTRPKPKPKPAPKAKAPVVKKLKPPPKPKKKEEPKPAKEKKGQKVYKRGDFQETFEDGEKRYSCNVCSKSFKNIKHFTQHYSYVHLKQRPKLRSCHLCDIKVKDHKRPFHMEECHGIPAPSCGACGKKFAKISQVLSHQKFYHMGESRYRCEQCNLGFFTSHKLKVHMVKHEPEKPFKGEVLDEDYKETVDETGGKNYTCEICSKTFKTRAVIKRHLREVHLKIRQRLSGCNLCDMKVPHNLKALHMEEHHGVPAPSCKECGKKFVLQCKLEQHMKFYHKVESDFHCEVCNKTFLTRFKLTDHQRVHKEYRPFECKICQKSFRWRRNLKEHLKIHEGHKRHV